MANEWRETTIADICDVFDGPHATPKKTDFGPVFLGITSLQKGRIDLSNAERLSEEDFKKWTRRVTPRTGDLVFSYETKLGEAAIIPESLRCCLGRRMALMRPRADKVDGRFLLYYYLGPEFQDVIRARTIHGSTVERIALIEFPRYPVRLPELEEQRAIAHILGTLDDKIELNRKMNETLEAMARALFQSWFVDFDPVRAKAAVRREHPRWTDAEVCRAALPTLSPEIAALFPDSFENSELGEIPKGWQARRLGDVSEAIFSGGTPSTTNANYWGGDIPWFSSGETREKFIITTEKTITNQGVENSSTRFAKAGTTAIASAGQGNTRGQASMLLIDTYINQSVVALSANRELLTDAFLFFDLERRYDEFRRISDGHSSRGSLTTKLLRGLAFVVPSLRTVQAFDRFASQVVARVGAARRQSKVLSEIRDALLPKLISGELRLNALPSAKPPLMEVSRG